MHTYISSCVWKENNAILDVRMQLEWNKLKLITGECGYFNIVRNQGLFTSFIHGQNAPDREPLALPLSTAPKGVIKGADVTEAFQSHKQKSSLGPDCP